MKHLILIIAAMSFALSVSGKDIKGRVLDMEGRPLEYVNVVLFQDSVFLDGVITDVNGKFILSSNVTDDLKSGCHTLVSTQHTWMLPQKVNWEISKCQLPVTPC